MIPTMARLSSTQTWGGRLAEVAPRSKPPAEEMAAPLDDWFATAAFLLAFLYDVPPPAIVFSRTFGTRARLAGEAETRSPEPVPMSSPTFGARSIVTASPRANTWELTDRRRLFLIDKQFQGGLAAEEEAELEELQASHGAYLDAIQPPPFDKLEELEAFARQLNATHLLPPP